MLIAFVLIEQQCQLYKPDRAHHCSSCGFCVLKMDQYVAPLSSLSSLLLATDAHRSNQTVIVHG